MSLPSATSDVGTDEKPVVTEKKEEAPVEESSVEEEESSSIEEVAHVEVAPVEEKKLRKPHRWRPGTHALQKYQREKFHPVTPRRGLRRQLQEIMNQQGYYTGGIRWTKAAIEALHEARDSYAMDLFAASERRKSVLQGSDGMVTTLASLM